MPPSDKYPKRKGEIWNPLQEGKDRKESALLGYQKAKLTGAQNKRDRLAQAQKEASKYDWLKGGLRGLGAGAGTGFKFGGPVGALIGGGIGAIGGGIAGEYGGPDLVSDLTGAARTVGRIGGMMNPDSKLLNMLDIQAQQQAQLNEPGVEDMGQWDAGSNYGADMEGFEFSGGIGPEDIGQGEGLVPGGEGEQDYMSADPGGRRRRLLNKGA